MLFLFVDPNPLSFLSVYYNASVIIILTFAIFSIISYAILSPMFIINGYFDKLYIIIFISPL